MTDIFEKGLYLGLGALSVTREKAEKIISELVDKGKITQDESGRVLKSLMEKADAEKKILEEKLEQALEKMMKKMNLVSQKDLTDIHQKLDELTKKLDKLDKQNRKS